MWREMNFLEGSHSPDAGGLMLPVWLPAPDASIGPAASETGIGATLSYVSLLYQVHPAYEAPATPARAGWRLAESAGDALAGPPNRVRDQTRRRI